MKKGSIRPRTLKRIAALEELASLGIGRTMASELTGLSYVSIERLCLIGKVEMPKQKTGARPWLEPLVLRDYGKPGLTVAQMAERYSTTPASVHATVWRLRGAGKIPAHR